MLSIIFLTLVGLGCGVAIYGVTKLLPEEDEALKKAEEISQFLPGMNCGACGKPGCFAYAGEVAKDIKTLDDFPCMTLLNDEAALAKLGEYLGVELSAGDKKIALIHCDGDSKVLYHYEGVNTCKGAAQLSAGYKECPYGCLGFGDCSVVCPENAISINKEKQIAVIDPEKCIGCGLCVKECPLGLIEVVPADLPQYLACNYLNKMPIPGRNRCSIGCIHCKLCVKASPDGEITWDEKKDLPAFDLENMATAQAGIDKCPKKVIYKRDSPLWGDKKKAESKPEKEKKEAPKKETSDEKAEA